MTVTGTCPTCQGSLRRPVPAEDPRRQYLPMIHGYDEATDTLPCNNCGGQTMDKPTGTVLLRADGTPCVHEYTVTTVGRCLTRYRCRHCPHVHEIDSGD